MKYILKNKIESELYIDITDKNYFSLAHIDKTNMNSVINNRDDLFIRLRNKNYKLRYNERFYI